MAYSEITMSAHLHSLREQTLNRLKQASQAADATQPDSSGDMYDQASSARDHDICLSLVAHERQKIIQIDAALLRIQSGEYGFCEECEEEIPIRRLKIMPFTKYCVKCQAVLEKLQKVEDSASVYFSDIDELSEVSVDG